MSTKEVRFTDDAVISLSASTLSQLRDDQTPNAHMIVLDRETLEELSGEAFAAVLPEEAQQLLLIKLHEMRTADLEISDERFAEAVSTRTKGTSFASSPEEPARPWLRQSSSAPCSGLTEEFYQVLAPTGFTRWHPKTQRNAIETFLKRRRGAV